MDQNHSNVDEPVHFVPYRVKKFLGSRRLHIVFSRHALSSITSAGVDYLVFMTVYWTWHQVFLATYIARGISLFFNFMIMKRFVYYSDTRFINTFPKYLALVILNAFLSSTLVIFFAPVLWGKVFLAKVLSDSLLYLFNFAMLNFLIFRHR